MFPENAVNHEDSKSAPVVLQIKDISGKLLYSEAKAQTRYATMMQASASHELRNPAAGIIYQMNNLREELLQLTKICTMMQTFITVFA